MTHLRSNSIVISYFLLTSLCLVALSPKIRFRKSGLENKIVTETSVAIVVVLTAMLCDSAMITSETRSAFMWLLGPAIHYSTK